MWPPCWLADVLISSSTARWQRDTIAFVDEARLIEKLRLIEALFAGATTEGERGAAAEARSRILERLRGMEQSDPPIEYQFPMPDDWSKRVFLALLRRYDIKPYRYKGQRRSTVMARVSRRFLDETLWPEYQQIAKELRGYLEQVTERVIAEVIHKDSSEASEVAGAPQLGPAAPDKDPA